MHIRLDMIYFLKEKGKVVFFSPSLGSDFLYPIFLSNWKLGLAIFYHTLYTEKDQFNSDHLHHVPAVWIINAYALINAYCWMQFCLHVYFTSV